MIRNVKPEDTKAIACIYNEYVMNGTATFETEAVTEVEMGTRIAGISRYFPYLVYETDEGIAGYCYAHQWKERAAYRFTLEVAVYLSPGYTGKGVGKQLMLKLIEETRRNGYHSLIACITEGNDASKALYASLGFKQSSYFGEVGYKFGQWLGIADYQLIL